MCSANGSGCWKSQSMTLWSPCFLEALSLPPNLAEGRKKAAESPEEAPPCVVGTHFGENELASLRTGMTHPQDPLGFVSQFCDTWNCHCLNRYCSQPSPPPYPTGSQLEWLASSC